MKALAGSGECKRGRIMDLFPGKFDCRACRFGPRDTGRGVWCVLATPGQQRTPVSVILPLVCKLPMCLRIRISSEKVSSLSDVSSL